MEGDCEIAKNGVTVKLLMQTNDMILKKRGLEPYGRVQRYIDSEVIRLMSPYTPKDTGALIDSATSLTKIGSGEVKQGGATAPYAHRWYYNPANFTGSPTRGTYWFERMKENGGKKSILEGAIRESGAKK